MFVEWMCEWMDSSHWLISQPNFDSRTLNIVLPSFLPQCVPKLWCDSLMWPATVHCYWCVVTGSLIAYTANLPDSDSTAPLSQVPPPTRSHFGSHFCAFACNTHLLLLEYFPFSPFLIISPSQSNSNPTSFLKTPPCSSTLIDIFLPELLLYQQLRKISTLDLNIEGTLKYPLYTWWCL